MLQQIKDFDLKKPSNAALLGTVIYLFLSIIKLVSGHTMQSASVFADGLNNLTDIISSFTIFIGIYIAKKPKDDDHHFDHYKYETLASFLVSLLMLVIGFDIVKSGIIRFIDKDFLTTDPKLIEITIITILILLATYSYIHKTAHLTKSMGLKTTAKEMFNDILITMGTLFGTILTQFNLPVFDVLISVIVGLLTMYSAISILKDTTFVLSDGFYEDDLIRYKNCIYENEFVHNIKHIRGRHSGSKIYLDVVIELDGNLTVYQSHKITEDIENYLSHRYQIDDVDIHVEPYVTKKDTNA